MSEGSQVSKVTLCVKILKWRSLTDSGTKGRYRAARAAKNWIEKMLGKSLEKVWNRLKKFEKVGKKLGKKVRKKYEKCWKKLIKKKIDFFKTFFIFFSSANHFDQMSECDGSQVSKVTICVQILKSARRRWRWIRWQWWHALMMNWMPIIALLIFL